MRRRDFRIRFFVLGVFAAVFFFTFLTQSFKKLDEEAGAASLANFDPGYIMSDYQMGNYNSMSEAEIQAFLTAKNSCPNTNYDAYLQLSANTRYKWHWKDGHFVCLSEELFGDGEVIGSGDTAAHIIWQAAQDYRINPQVLLVLLQKETGLITDTIPNDGDYRKATGYGCPDTAPCSSQYYGFKNQIRKAAALFRTVLDGGWTNYPLGENYVQYNPDPDCGGSVVNIRSLATSALYRYTPYQPNAGALAAGYGTAYCGAYGNRNFYLYFEDWFGGIIDVVEPVVEAETKFERPVEDGLYQIYSKAYDNKVVDIRGGIEANMRSAETIVFNRNGGVTDNQLFYIKYNEKTGYYNIVNLASNLYMDVRGSGTSNMTPIIMFAQNYSCNQDWLFEKDDSGHVSIVSRCSSKVLDAASSGALSIYSNHGGNNQKWQLVSVQTEENIINDDGDYQITIGNNVFDISGGVYDGMTFGYVVSFNNKDQINQVFNIEYNTDKRVFRIMNPATRLFLTAGSKVSVQRENNTCEQDWIFVSEGENYRMYSACNRAPVSVSGEKVGSCYAIGTGLGKQTIIGLKEVTTGGINVDTDIDIVEGDEEIIEDIDYQIMVADKEKTIDISGGVTSEMQSGNLVIFAARKINNDNQIFRFRYDEDKAAYYIYNPTSELYLDVVRSGRENGTRVIGFHYNGGYCNQLWEVDKVEGGYIIKSSCSGKVLSGSDIKIGSAMSVAIYDYSVSDDQVWKIVEP
ncbi:RICIN domain-containing protein [Candidatus Saccharibacteria bacterium]|nr:RICIN domain-containing protein [Candidatus Saccharibacteria bacterium]